MVSKEKFLNFIALVKKNKEAISALGNSLDSYSIRGLSIFSLFMSADKIAGNYLDMDEDYFYEDFWAMLYDGELEIGQIASDIRQITSAEQVVEDMITRYNITTYRTRRK